MSSSGLERKVNEFLSENMFLKVRSTQVTTGFGNIVALITYEA